MTLARTSDHVGVASADLTVDEARALTQRIQQTGAVMWSQIIKAYQGRAWAALGYDSWDAYCDSEFDGARLMLPREDRREVVASLAEVGMSTRAIAAATGVSHQTIANDQAVVKKLTPAPRPTTTAAFPHEEYRPPVIPDDEILDAEIIDEPAPPRVVTGTDGKSYTLKPKPEPSAPRRSPLTDTADRAGWDLRKAVERVERIVADDRFTANKQQVSTHLSAHLSYAIEACQRLATVMEES